MARSLWKGPFVDSFLLKKSNKIGASRPSLPQNVDTIQSGSTILSNTQKNHNIFSNKKTTEKNLRFQGSIRVWSRRSFILPEYIDQFFEIYNGKQFISFKVHEDMVGHKFGEFATTRKKTLHKKKMKGK